jgi:hypothetical protein
MKFWGPQSDVLDENWKEVIDLPTLLAIISEAGVLRFLKSSSRAELQAYVRSGNVTLASFT